MPFPPQQVKTLYKKGKVEVIYQSNLDQTQYALFELTRGALRDSALFLGKKFLEAFYQHFKRHTGNARKGFSYKVFSNKDTKYPRVQVGLRGVHGFYAYFQEFGTSTGIPRLGLLTKTTQDNIDELKKIQAQYLTALNEDEQTIKGMIDEREQEGDIQ